MGAKRKDPNVKPKQLRGPKKMENPGKYKVKTAKLKKLNTETLLKKNLVETPKKGRGRPRLNEEEPTSVSKKPNSTASTPKTGNLEQETTVLGRKRRSKLTPLTIPTKASTAKQPNSTSTRLNETKVADNGPKTRCSLPVQKAPKQTVPIVESTINDESVVGKRRGRPLKNSSLVSSSSKATTTPIKDVLCNDQAPVKRSSNRFRSNVADSDEQQERVEEPAKSLPKEQLKKTRLSLKANEEAASTSAQPSAPGPRRSLRLDPEASQSGTTTESAEQQEPSKTIETTSESSNQTKKRGRKRKYPLKKDLAQNISDVKSETKKRGRPKSCPNTSPISTNTSPVNSVKPAKDIMDVTSTQTHQLDVPSATHFEVTNNVEESLTSSNQIEAETSVVCESKHSNSDEQIKSTTNNKMLKEGRLIADVQIEPKNEAVTNSLTADSSIRSISKEDIIFTTCANNTPSLEPSALNVDGCADAELKKTDEECQSVEVFEKKTQVAEMFKEETRSEEIAAEALSHPIFEDQPVKIVKEQIQFVEIVEEQTQSETTTKDKLLQMNIVSEQPTDIIEEPIQLTEISSAQSPTIDKEPIPTENETVERIQHKLPAVSGSQDKHEEIDTPKQELQVNRSQLSTDSNEQPSVQKTEVCSIDATLDQQQNDENSELLEQPKSPASNTKNCSQEVKIVDEMTCQANKNAVVEQKKKSKVGPSESTKLLPTSSQLPEIAKFSQKLAERLIQAPGSKKRSSKMSIVRETVRKFVEQKRIGLHESNASITLIPKSRSNVEKVRIEKKMGNLKPDVSPIKILPIPATPKAQKKVESKQLLPPKTPYQEIDDCVICCDVDLVTQQNERAHKCKCKVANQKCSQESCLNRAMHYECPKKCDNGEQCKNRRFQNREYAKLECFDTGLKGRGVRALEAIPKGTFIIEYLGEIIDHRKFKRRSSRYAKDPRHTHHYVMSLNANTYIDATKRGNMARFVNHSCDPNAATEKWTVDRRDRIGFFAIRDIKEGEELVFDYKFERFGDTAQKCYCGSANCRGIIGSESDSKQHPVVEDPEQSDGSDNSSSDESSDEEQIQPELEKLKTVKSSKSIEVEVSNENSKPTANGGLTEKWQRVGFKDYKIPKKPPNTLGTSTNHSSELKRSSIQSSSEPVPPKRRKSRFEPIETSLNTDALSQPTLIQIPTQTSNSSCSNTCSSSSTPTQQQCTTPPSDSPIVTQPTQPAQPPAPRRKSRFEPIEASLTTNALSQPKLVQIPGQTPNPSCQTVKIPPAPIFMPPPPMFVPPPSMMPGMMCGPPPMFMPAPFFMNMPPPPNGVVFPPMPPPMLHEFMAVQPPPPPQN